MTDTTETTAPRKRVITPKVEEIVITKPADEPAAEVEAPLSEQTKREMEMGRKVLAALG